MGSPCTATKRSPGLPQLEKARAPQLEKARTQQWRPNTVKNKNKLNKFKKKKVFNWVKGMWEFSVLLCNFSVNLKLFSNVKVCINTLKSRYLQYCLIWIWNEKYTRERIYLKVITVVILCGRIGSSYFLLFTYLYFLSFLQWLCSTFVVLLIRKINKIYLKLSLKKGLWLILQMHIRSSTWIIPHWVTQLRS